MNTAVARNWVVQEPAAIIGKAPIVRAAFEGRDQLPLWQELYPRVSADPTDAAAFLDLSTLLRVMGDEPQASICEQAALDLSRQYRIVNGKGTGLRILVLMAPGDFMTNTPIEFLLEGSDTTILLAYIDADTKSLADLPAHDVAFLAVGESTENAPILDNLDTLLRGWSTPIVNAAPGAIRSLSRRGVAAIFASDPLVYVPPVEQVAREVLYAMAADLFPPSALLADTSFPIIVRPFDTHAGKGMAKIDTRQQLAAYLKTRDEEVFYTSAFVDYSSPDGKFRKHRVAFIDGKAYASHLAVSDNWMVHYLNAGMMDHAERRAEEAAWMVSFDEDSALRNADAYASIVKRLGLDYFAIDCAELPDGRILLFEADVAMIVHSMDCERLFAYKKPAMAKLFRAFEGALANRAALPTITSARG
jgi:hypothetical protein